ncbi:hypothetical protein HDR59_00155 [bacterium]|nr:hypothetical protein [bacterium]
MKKILILLLLSGCCSTKKYDALLDSRIGISETELIKQVGNPSSKHKTKEVLSLEYYNQRTVMKEKRWCSTQYFIKDNKVDSWAHRGNDCCISCFSNPSS